MEDLNTLSDFQNQNNTLHASYFKNTDFLNIDFQEKILRIKRVTKVVKGGKKLSFSVIIAVGDYKKYVGIGLGKGDDVNTAIEKGILNAKKNLISIPLTYSYSIPKPLKASYGASKIILRPAKLGTGIIAGSSIRTILELVGVKNIICKQQGSNNIFNNVKACLLALKSLSERIECNVYKSFVRKQFYNKILNNFSKVNT